VHEALGEEGVVSGARAGVGDAVRVAQDLNGLFQAVERDLPSIREMRPRKVSARARGCS
jgi:hypothetical protein